MPVLLWLLMCLHMMFDHPAAGNLYSRPVYKPVLYCCTNMSANKEGAYGGLSTTTGKERKTWDKEEFAKQAKEKDAENRERAKERAEALKSGRCSQTRFY